MRCDPTAVVSTTIFHRNQFPYMELRRPFIVGTAESTWKATTGHWFLRLLQEKGKLVRLYTQNIDGLDFQVGLPADKVVTVHGNLHQIRCESCGAAYPSAEFVQAVRKNIKDIYGVDPEAPAVSQEIPCLACGRPQVKPATVLFGGSLPDSFFQSAQEDFPDEVDLLFVIGTSLVVGPANSLVRMVHPFCKRVVVNREPVGQELGLQYDHSSRDIFLSGDCESSITALIHELGWHDDLLRLQAQAQAQAQAHLPQPSSAE